MGCRIRGQFTLTRAISLQSENQIEVNQKLLTERFLCPG